MDVGIENTNDHFLLRTAAARLTVTLVLPTPPLPLRMAIL